MKNILEKLMGYIAEENVKGLMRFCLILLPFVGGGIWGIGAIVTYVTRHKEALILVGVATCMIIPALMGKKKTLPAVNTPVTNGNIAFFERLLIQCLYSIFTSYTRQFQIIPPGKFSDLKDDLPSGLDIGKNTIIYRFKVIAEGTPLEAALFHEILTVHLEEKLASGELALGKPVIEFGSQLYPKIFLEECLCAGGIWHISMLICDNENVARYIANKRQSLLLRHSPITMQYEDGDF